MCQNYSVRLCFRTCYLLLLINTISICAFAQIKVSGKVQLSMNVNNVLNKTYWVGAQNYLRLFPGTPRNLMFNVTYKI